MPHSLHLLNFVVATVLMLPALQLRGISQESQEFTPSKLKLAEQNKEVIIAQTDMKDELELEGQLTDDSASTSYQVRSIAVDIFQRAKLIYSAGDLTNALLEFERALTLYKEEDSALYRVETLLYISEIHLNQNRYNESLEISQQAFSLAQTLPNSLQSDFFSASSLIVAGSALSQMSKYEEALNMWELSLNLNQSINDPHINSSILVKIGSVYAHGLGQYEKGINICTRALDIAKEYQNTLWSYYIQASSLNCIGLSYNGLENFEEAFIFFQESLETARQSNDPFGEFTALVNLGWNKQARGEYEQAVVFFQQAILTIQSTGDLVSEAFAIANLGYSYGHIGQYEQSIELLQQGLSIIQSTDFRYAKWRILRGFGVVLALQNKPELAIIFYKKAANITESIREDIGGLDFEIQQSFLSTVADDYRVLANLLLEQGRIPEAQQVLDLLKLEEIREFTRTTRATWTGTDLQYTKIEQPVVDAHGSLIALGQEIYACRQIRCGDLENLREQQRVLTDSYEKQVSQFEAAIASNDQEDDLFQSPNSLSDDAYKLLQANPDAVLIYPFVTDDKLWLLWAAAGGSVGSVPVTVSRGELSTVVQQFGAQLTDLSFPAEVQASSQQLYRWLIEPLETELQANNIRQLIFVNDRVTRYIPMAALYDGEQYLLEHYTISTVIAPAITDTEATLVGIDESVALGLGLTQAVSGFNPLPAVAQELDAIIRSDDADPRGIYPGQVFLDDDFTLKALQANVEFRQILHIATHAEFAPSRPEDSFIVLGNGDRMKIQDIEVMQESLRDLHLVVLSACKTALGGTAGDGTEIAGISSYFLAANRAETVIASLWAVNDTSTSLLMQRFYEFLASGELTKAEALRQAQLSLLYDEDTETRLAATRATISVESRDGNPLATNGFQHPYHWAPFILIGNGL
ncbi:CHAT domain-containing protein [Adonisia turfae]|uniref:CHAT domain-containing protein n=1 Tax=Adonisia turfae CCMR0081 TaxID=2292702 RepID=A0A6M0RQB4_9CYAN|nr:CHAT domain-containing protein [Adonisia turfae]NEZ58050.1 CHAT domain-containing protein [Adonisia turfae CCMR0081]